MENLRLMYIYTNFDRDLAIIPYKNLNEDTFICNVFKYDKLNNIVQNPGDYFYHRSGICFGVNGKNITTIVALQNLHPKMQKAIKEWKKQYKKDNKNVQ